jgi:hypothetical protein
MSIKKPIPKLKSREGEGRSLSGRILRYIAGGGLFLVPLLYLLLSLAILALVATRSYESILSWYSTWRPDGLDVRAFATRCFTPRWYEWLRANRLPLMAVIGVVLILYLLYSRRVWYFLQALLGDIAKVMRFMVRTFMELNGWQRGWLLLLFMGIGVYRIYFFFAFPLHPDELYSYLFFVRQGFLVSATSYPLPNNHMLYNILCSFPGKLSWLSPKAVMRLPNMAGDLLLLYSIFCLFSRRAGFGRAIGIVAGVAFSYLIAYYSVQGRGYEWQNICALAGGLACWKCFMSEDRHLRKGYALFVVSSVAGFYINPSFLYPFTALALMSVYFSLRRRDYRTLFIFSRAVLLTGVLVFIFYLPLVLGSSWRALAEGTHDKRWVDYGGLIDHIADLAYDFKTIAYLGRPGFWLLCGLVVLFGYLYRSGKLRGAFYDYSVAYFVCAAVALAFWSVATLQYPMDRTLCFLALAMYLFFLNACYDLLEAWTGRWAPWAFGCLLVVRALGSLRGLYWEPDSVGVRPEAVNYRILERDLDSLDRLSPASWQITRSDDYYSMYVRLHLIDRGKEGRVIFERGRAVGEVIFWPVSYPAVIPVEEYRLWGDKRMTVEAKSLDIYVLKRLEVSGRGNGEGN